MKKKSTNPKPEFFNRLKELIKTCDLTVEQFVPYAEHVNESLKPKQRMNARHAGRIAQAIHGFCMRDKKNLSKEDQNKTERFWQAVLKELEAFNNAKPVPPGISGSEFGSLVFAALGMGMSSVAKPEAPVTASLSDAELLHIFSPCLGGEADKCWQLVTRGINLGSGADALRLAQVYVDLDTLSPRPRRSDEPMSEQDGGQYFSALEVLFAENSRRIVLVGEPGSGKSTFLQFVLLCLTYKHSRDTKALENFAGLDEKVPAILRSQQDTAIPFRIILREFAAELDPDTKGGAEDVVKFLAGQVRDRCSSETAGQVEEVLKRGLAFVLFDGLDEVPRPQVPAVRRAIQLFTQGDYVKCRVAVTCRTRSYEMVEQQGGQNVFVFKLDGFPTPAVIAPLSRGRQAEFIGAWYRELERAQPQFKKGEGTTCASTLITALADDRLQEMAGTPFFLTAMAALHRPDKELPNTSAELMDELVRGVLEEARKRQTIPNPAAAQPEMAALLQIIPDGFKLLRSRLETVAYLAREKRQDHNSRFVDEDTIRQKLRLVKTVDDDWVDKLMDALRHRAGLLQSQDGTQFEFAYRFEEFLAGCHLVNEDAWTMSFDKRCFDLLEKQKDYARQVVLWAAGFYVHVRGRKGPVRDLVSALVPSRPLTTKDDFHLITLDLAADIARDAGMESWQDEDVAYASDTTRRLRVRLEEVRDQPGQFTPKHRAAAAAAIGRLGDTRPGVGLARDGQGKVITVQAGGKDIVVPGFVWCGARGQIQPGDAGPVEQAFPQLPAFNLGEPKGRNDRAFQSFTQGDLRVATPRFFISKYPVTVAQYQAFVDAGGYERDEFWTDEGKKWRRGDAGKEAIPDWLREEYDGETFPISRPKDYSPVFQTPNHPRVGICWFEARAYAAWLNSLEIRTAIADSLALQPDGVELRLPTEAEWELAARWNAVKRQPDDRRYPWGETNSGAELTGRCNWHETGINSTSAVGLFPDGNAGCGAADMAGNVWEWCQTKRINSNDKNAMKEYNSDVCNHADGVDARVLRGGSWGDGTPESRRAASRDGDHPAVRYYHVGFRVVSVVVSDR
jgi:formylglycine-generating enzyme required for sulfatase activity